MQEVATIPVKNILGEDVGKEEVKLQEKSINGAMIYSLVTKEAWNRKPGTAAVKTRAEVKGGGAKPWRQKGTGRARHGSTRSPLWRGGGVAFGPQPGATKRKINRKERKKALRQIMEDYIRKNQCAILATEEVTGKTRQAARFLSSLNIRGSLLVLYARRNSPVLRGVRNIERVFCRHKDAFLLSDLIAASYLLFEKEAFQDIRKRLWQ